MLDWKKYQEEVAKLFCGLNCNVKTDVLVKGARANHMIDVCVEFKRFGLETMWVVECKFWNRNVPKEKVLVLKSIVDDVGANRGILVTERGFQSGTISASKYTNITLTRFDELTATLKNDVLNEVFSSLDVKVFEVKDRLHKLFTFEKTGPGSAVSRPLPGINGRAVGSAIAQLVVLEHGFSNVKIGKCPYPVKFDDDGNSVVSTSSKEEFVELAAEVIEAAVATLKEQLAAVHTE